MPAAGAGVGTFAIQLHLDAALQLLVELLHRGLAANQSTAWILVCEDPLDIFNTMEWAELAPM